jgi:hypothetical protein
MRILFNSLALIGCLAGGSAFADPLQGACGTATNLVTNCGFEDVATSTGSGATGWNIGNGSGTVAAQVLGNTYGIDTFANSGTQAYSLSSSGIGLGTIGPSKDGPATLVLSQSVALPFTGNYELDFFVSQDTNPSGFINFFQASFGGASTAAMSNFAATPGYIEETLFVSDLAGPTALLAFTGQDDLGFLDIDDVSVTYVPEPGTLALFGIGLVGLLAATLRRSGQPFARA